MNKLKLTLNKKNTYNLIIFVGISILGLLYILLITSKCGLGLTPDSAAYIAGARNIANGNGIVLLYNDLEKRIPLRLWASITDMEKPLIFHWPPFYPLILSIFAILRLDLISSARILNSVFFGINLYLISFFIYKYTKSLILTVGASIFFLFSKVTIGIHTLFMSEPLFFSLGFLGLFYLIFYFENSKKNYVIISSILIGLSIITRYAGISFLLTLITLLFLFEKSSFKKKLSQLVLSAVLSSIFLLLWVFQTYKTGNNLTDRLLYFHPPSLDEIQNIPGVINKWFLIGSFTFNIDLIIMIILLSTLIFICIYNYIKSKFNILLKINISFFIFIIYYLLILLLSRTFFDAKIPIAQDRLLFPIFISIFILFFINLFYFVNLFSIKKFLFPALFLLVFIFNGFLIYNTYFYSKSLYLNGQYYSSKKFINSNFLSEIKNLPNEKILFSDATEIIYLYTLRKAYTLPAKFDPYNNIVNKNYYQQLDEMYNKINYDKGYIIDFSYLDRPFLPTTEFLKDNYTLFLYHKDDLGEIYEALPEKLSNVFISNNFNFKNYWREMNECNFKIENDNIIIQASGDDPWFENKFRLNYNNKKTLMLIINLYTKVEGEIRIFYGIDDKEYVIEDSEFRNLKIGNNIIYFKIPYNYKNLEGRIKKIRIDPINKKEDIIIKSIVLAYIN